MSYDVILLVLKRPHFVPQDQGCCGKCIQCKIYFCHSKIIDTHVAISSSVSPFDLGSCACIGNVGLRRRISNVEFVAEVIVGELIQIT